MDLKKLTEETILKNMTPEQQKAVLDSVMASVQESKKVRSQKVAENIDLVMQALQKIEAKMLARVDGAASKVEQVAANVKNGKDGRDGKDGKPGKDGAIGPKGSDGRDGKDGKDGKDGRDGVDGVSVVNAFLDFDNSLVIELSNGKQINVGGVLSNETADKVRVVANGGGTSQGVLDALAYLQAEIDALVKIPSQTGNSGKFLTTNGSALSWASVAGGLNYQGTWNASTNTPTLVSSTGTNGYYYVVNVAGTTNLNGITDWQAGDWVIFNGSTWQKIDQSWAQSGANSDITSLSGITGGITSPNYIGFNTSYSTALTAGQLGWDGNNTLGLGMAGGNVTQHIGEDQFFYCKASSAITKGQVVMFTGAVGASGVPTGAPATGITDGTYIMGVAAEDIALNGFGLVQTFGTLRNVNTSGYSDGDILWYNPSVTGGLTKTKPSAPNVKVQIAAVINGGSSGGGTILIRLDFGSTLGGTDSNAQITSVANGNLLTYDGGNGYWKNTDLAAGTGISVSKSTNGVLTVTNSAPDQTVALTGGTGITTSGTYPNFTITNSAPDQTVSLTAGTGITTSGTYPNFTITNSAPDRTVAITGGGTTTVTGTYPNFTVSSSDAYTGTVTSVTAGTGLSGGVITGSGTIALANTTVTAGSYTYGSFTVDAQGRLTAASSGTAPVTSVSGTGVISSSGGTTPTISISQATTTTSGYLSSTDWNTFNNKQAALVSGTTIKTVNSTSLLGSGDVSVGVTSITAGTGLSGGTITGSGTIALANTAVTAGSYTAANITVDAQGRITSASNGSGGVTRGGQVFTSNGTFTIPSGVTALKVTAVGGGGGGSGSTSYGGSGGGSGGAGISFLTGLTPGNTISVTIGGGGTAGNTSTYTGGAGGNTVVSSGTQTITTITAGGGGGGTDRGAKGGAGGTTSGATLNLSGNAGEQGGSSTSSNSGNGGGSILGGGAQGVNGSGGTTGNAGTTGGGGSGGANTNNGGAGGAGVVIFEW